MSGTGGTIRLTLVPAAGPSPPLILTRQVTHTCVLLSSGILLCGGPRPVFVQDLISSSEWLRLPIR